MRAKRIQLAVMATIGLLALVTLGAVAWKRSNRPPQLPYHDRFDQNRTDGWLPLGGRWRIRNGEMMSSSDGLGSKLITGGKDWSNYAVDADIQLVAHGGDVGVILRVNDAELGMDSYRGYYVGLRSEDEAVVVGRADHSWLEVLPMHMDGGVRNGIWYRLHVVAWGCTIAVQATNLATHQQSFSALRDVQSRCVPAGAVGLRSTDTRAAWRNIRISEASEADLVSVLRHVSRVAGPQYPMREDENSRMREQYFSDTYPYSEVDPVKLSDNLAATPEEEDLSQKLPVTLLQSIRSRSDEEHPHRVHGVVSFTDPLFLQDESGGMELSVSNAGSLSVGDEVDAVGTVVPRGNDRIFAATDVKLIRERAPITAVTISAADAVSRTHEGSLVEISGEVLSTKTNDDGSTVIRLKEDDELFDGVLEGNAFRASSFEWSDGSIVRLRGVCVPGQWRKDGAAFHLLIAQSTDVVVLAGPSWLHGWRFACLCGGGASIVLLAFYLFIRFERAKSDAILRERERISHDMHDTLAQSFAGVGFHLQGVSKTLHGEALLPPLLVEEIDIACRMVREAHREASASIAALHPESYLYTDTLTLLQRSLRSMSDRKGIHVKTSRDGEPRTLPLPVADVFLRVGQEALANVLRHSNASEVRLSLAFTASSTVLTIEDNGLGFSTKGDHTGFGIDTMRRRCNAAGVDLDIVSEPGRGCTVRIVAPRRWPWKGWRNAFSTSRRPSRPD